jgi:hypothetical protein
MNGIDFDAVNAAARVSYRTLLPELIPGGRIKGPEYVCKNPRRADNRPGSFSVNFVKGGLWKDFATGEGGSDFVSLVAHVRGCSQGDAARELAEHYSVPLYNGNKPGNGSTIPTPQTPEPTPEPASRTHPWTKPPHFHDEIRRHNYDRDGATIRVKIKRTDGSFVNWYRVPDGWQSRKPDNYRAVPYCTRAINPFDPELIGDELLWPEGEKDVNCLDKINLPAFTFGGTGDGLPNDVGDYLKAGALSFSRTMTMPGASMPSRRPLWRMRPAPS